ncbi:MAG TPA: phage tail tape measure protein, partial [Chloroflexota bacterium]|nr:phage tail tape measure protein [Chloroflexota bacterium]
VEDAGHVSDVFFNTINKGVVTGPELAASLGPVTQSAKAAGVSLDELGGLIAGVTKEGGPAAQNINNLNNFLQKITTTDAQTELRNLGIVTTDATGAFRPVTEVIADLGIKLGDMTEAGKANALQAIFPDAQARIGAQTLISQIGFVNEAIETNRTEVGSASAAYVKMGATFNSQSALLGNSVQAIGNAIGAQLIPTLTGLTSMLSEVTARFLDLSPETQRWIAIGAAVTTGLTVLTAAGLGLVAFLPSLMAGFAAVGTLTGITGAAIAGLVLPVTLAIAAGALLTAAWVNNWGDIQGKTEAVWEFLQTHVFTPIIEALAHFGMVVLPEALAAWEGVTAGIQRTWGDLMAFLQPAIAAFGAFWQDHHTTIEQIVKAAWDMMTLGIRVAWELIQGIVLAGLKVLQGDWSGAWDVMSAYLGAAWETITSTVGQALALLGSALAAAWDGIRGVATAAWQAITSTISEAWEAIKATVSQALAALGSALSAAWDGVRGVAAAAWQGIASTITGVFASIVGPIQGIISQVMGLIGPVLDKIGQIRDFRPPDLGEVFANIDRARQGAADAARSAGASLVPGRAAGGPVLAGMPYIVGERRPELFVPREPGYILPSVPSMAGGGGAAPAPNVTYKIDVHVPGLIGSKDDVVRAIYNGLRELERSGLRLGAA